MTGYERLAERQDNRQNKRHNTLPSQEPDLLGLNEIKYEGDGQGIKEWEKELEGLEWDVEEGEGNNENGAKGDDEDKGDTSHQAILGGENDLLEHMHPPHPSFR